MTSLTISRTHGTISRTHGAFTGLLHEIGRVIDSIAAGARAAREYQELSNRTDAALAREGIARTEIPRVVFERNFA